jgi:penicillin-binding protein 1A
MFFFSLIKFGFYLSVILIVAGVGIVIGVIKTFSEQLPDVGYHSYVPSLNSKVFDSAGNLLTEFHEVENRSEKVPLSEIPLNMQRAIIAIEDTSFYQHYGISIKGIVRAMFANYRAGHVTQGASTITQQLARNAFLSTEQTFVRKIKEVLLSFKIERQFSKQEILTLYLNEIYFGHGAWGIASAAQVYFGKRPVELSLGECALLAGMPKNPSHFDPFSNPDAAKQRQILVLNSMVKTGMITEEEARVAKDTPLKLRSIESVKQAAPYFVEYVRSTLMKMYGAKMLYTGGLKIYTTVDLKMQEAAERTFLNAGVFKNKPLEKYPMLQGALVALEPSTGYIKAMVGGRDYEHSEFNRATQARRQPGSSFKPFVYTAAIDAGIPPNAVFEDEPIEIRDKWTGRVWSPANYGNTYSGAVTLKTALMKSINIISIKLMQKVGIQRVISYARKMGITTPLGAHLALALGACEVIPLEMAVAYGTLANGGIKVPATAITKIEDSKGNIIYENPYLGEEVLPATTAFVMVDMLSNVVNAGTGTRAKIDRPAAGKTGTTNDFIDAWFCGFTPNLVCVIYIGYDNRKSLGPGSAGGTVVAPIWHDFMMEALKDTPKLAFKEPKDVMVVNICPESGLLAGANCPKKTSQVFKRGTEPDTVCAIHARAENLDNYFDKMTGEKNTGDADSADSTIDNNPMGKATDSPIDGSAANDDSPPNADSDDPAADNGQD